MRSLRLGMNASELILEMEKYRYIISRGAGGNFNAFSMHNWPEILELANEGAAMRILTGRSREKIHNGVETVE